jgi:hypothetical protein
MELRPGLRLESATCDTQVAVVKAPKDAGDIDVRCGGEPMREGGEGTLLGKRYADDELGIELLCTQAGEGALTVGDQPLLVKGAKPLPSSD